MDQAKPEAQHVDLVEPPGHLIDSEDEPIDGYSLGWKTFAAIIALSLAYCATVINNMSFTIIKFQVGTVGGASIASWFSNAEYLVNLAVAPMLGVLSDRIGKKWIIVGGCAVGVVGSCVSASATTPGQIICGNALCGFAVSCAVLAIPANQEISTNRQRPLAMAINQTMGNCSSVLGVFVAAAFVKFNAGGNGGWQWQYYFQGCAYGFGGLVVLLTYFPPRPRLAREGNLRELLGGIDYVGIALMCGSFTSLLLGLTWGGVTYPWRSAQTIASLVCGIIGLIVFGLWEWLGKKDGIFDHRLMQSRNFPILMLNCTIDGMLLLGVAVLYSQQIGAFFTDDAVKIAAILSPYLVTSTFGCLPAGWLMTRTKSFRVLLVGSLVWCALFTGLMGIVTPDRLAIALVFSGLFGIGTAVTTVIPLSALALSVPSYLLGTAGAISISARSLGGIIGVTIFTAIHTNEYNKHVASGLSTLISSEGYSDATHHQITSILATGNPNLLSTSGLHPNLVQGVYAVLSDAQASSWTYVWVAVAGLIGANAVVSWFVESVAVRMNAHVESALEESEVRRRQLA